MVDAAEGQNTGAEIDGVFGVLSPQLMTTEWESSVPGSVKLPPRVVEPLSRIELLLRVSATLDGGTLLTVTVAVSEPVPPPSSVTVTEIV